MKTVLTVADSKVVRSMVARALSALGYELSEATSWRDGLEAARGCRPALVLLDFTRPGMDGRQGLEQLRADAATADVPVILLTDDADVDVAALGAAGHVVKPFQLGTLEREVGRVLGIPVVVTPGRGRPALRRIR
jgi:CheY-like chemotaxis protein